MRCACAECAENAKKRHKRENSHYLNNNKKENTRKRHYITRYLPPMGSRIILSMLRGPSVVRITSATALAAVMLPSCALRPVSRFVVVSVESLMRSVIDEYRIDMRWRVQCASLRVHA